MNYSTATKTLLDNINIPVTALTCNNSRCDDANHIHSLNTLYDEVSNALYSASRDFIPSSQCTLANQYVIPGWNDLLRDAHTEARHANVTWRDFGKPRHGPVCELMKTTRLRFKYTLRQCQAMEETARADALAKSLAEKDTMSFWKSIKNMNRKSIPLTQTIDGATGAEDISEMWKQHYSSILNCVTNDSCRDKVKSVLGGISSTDKLVITPSHIADAIRALKRGKSVGHALLAAEHFIHANPILNVIVSIIYTAFITHGHMPDSIMKTIIVPLVKNKTGNMSDKNNYRPIALVTAASKILELVLLNNIESFIDTKHTQFGFKRKHATDLCIYSLKNVIQYYRQHNSPVFTCFLDASRAFDRVNYWTLFNKLIQRGVPLLIVRLLCFWYNTQQCCIKWGKSTSMYFTTSNGVRQGGILSPRLFSLYIDYLSTLLHDLKVGCYIDSTCMNHYFYADDMCLLSPSPIGLQQLINVCTKYGIEHDIIFNPIKTKCVAFLPNRYKLSVPTVSLDGDDLVHVYTDNIKYLGVILSNNLKDDSDIMRQLRCLYASSNILLRKFAHCSLDVKLKLVQSFCLNLYCSSLWCVYTKQSLTKIRVAYNNIFRKLLGYRANTMFVNHRIDGFDASVRKSCFKFRQRALLCAVPHSDTCGAATHSLNIGAGSR